MMNHKQLIIEHLLKPLQKCDDTMSNKIFNLTNYNFIHYTSTRNLLKAGNQTLALLLIHLISGRVFLYCIVWVQRDDLA